MRNKIVILMLRHIMIFDPVVIEYVLDAKGQEFISLLKYYFIIISGARGVTW